MSLTLLRIAPQVPTCKFVYANGHHAGCINNCVKLPGGLYDNFCRQHKYQAKARANNAIIAIDAQNTRMVSSLVKLEERIQQLHDKWGPRTLEEAKRRKAELQEKIQDILEVTEELTKINKATFAPSVVPE